MPSKPSDPEPPISSLPQCGFGPDHNFDSLIKSNRFLFRVYTPKERSPFADDSDPFFVAPRYDELVARSPVDLPNVKFSEPAAGTYADVARHMEWTTRTSSTYVSTSFSFTWAVWEAVRRYHIGVKKDVEIAVIDATALDGRAATAIQLLEKSSVEERNEQFLKWYRFSQDSQSVLVYGMVPRTAVLASIPLLQILRKMPSYFLRKDIQVISGNPLDQVAWDYAKRKHNYRQFCQEMSKNFMGKSLEVRLRDSTAGAVRLGLAFLRPFIHNIDQDNFDVAVSYLRTLSLAISEWPGGWWVEDHPEVRKIVEVMVLAVAEELRDKYCKEKNEEISRLEIVIGGLKQSIKLQHEPNILAEDTELDSDGEFAEGLEESDEPTLVNPLIASSSPLHRRVSLPMSVVVPHKISISFQTPITPPESPRNSIFVPAVKVQLNDIISTDQVSPEQQSVMKESVQILPVHVTKSPPVSDEPASPPSTPPTGTPVFLPMKLPTILEADIVPEVDSLHELQDCDTDCEISKSLTEGAADQNYPESTEEREDGPSCEVQPVGQVEESGETTQDQELQQPEADHGRDSTIEQDRDRFRESFPVHPWISIRQLGSPFSSRRSSIMSVETLCDPIEFPAKRLSFASTSDSFEIVPTMRSLGLSSRAISFSDFSPKISPSSPPQIDAQADPVPPSPVLSEQSFELSRSLSGSSSSSTSSSVSSDLIVPLITPLPPSPAWSIDSLPSLSRSSSFSSISPTTPVISISENPSAISVDIIIPPKPPISLLAPLAGQEHVGLHVAHKRRARSGVVSETASYIVTGFLFGAFITIFLFSTQRKTMLYVT